jgi:hypothetical protein
MANRCLHRFPLCWKITFVKIGAGTGKNKKGEIEIPLILRLYQKEMPVPGKNRFGELRAEHFRNQADKPLGKVKGLKV